MGKNIKSYATTQQSISPGKGRDTLWQKSKFFGQNIVRPNHTHSFFHCKFTSKFFQIYVLSFGKISSKLYKFCTIHPRILRIRQNSHHLLIHYTLCFRCVTISRELSKIPANQVKFAPFAHKSHELCEFHTKIHPHLVHYFQNHRQRTPGNWSKSTRFRAVRPQLLRITRNSLNPHPWPAI